MSNGIYLFNRDLRIEDNYCLYNSLQDNVNIIYPIFILDSKQVDKNKNSYFNEKFVDFMCKSVYLLGKQIPLTIFYGDTISILEKMIHTDKNIEFIFNNYDVTPFAKNRSEKINNLCKKNNLKFFQGTDVFLGRDNHLIKRDGNAYLKFTPFYKNAISQIKKNMVCPKISTKYLSKLKVFGRNQNLHLLEKFFLPKQTYENCPFKPGRKEAENNLKKFLNSHIDYVKSRDIPSKNSTSHISPYLKLGILGPVEVMKLLEKTKNGKEIIRQLLWREFYLYIIEYSHTDYSKKSRTISKLNTKIKWKNSSSDFKKWCTGTTGIPWVDAGMRELNETGYMQNRLRMNVAMFLIFYLKIDWTWGEQYFAQKLIDYDYCNNLGGWLWSSSWEVHSNESFRVFSMSNQMKRFDPEGIYVKKWVPEVRDVPPEKLYDWCENWEKFNIKNYPHPIIKSLVHFKYPF